MADFITIIIVAIILVSAVSYIIREKKKGVKCIGCPSAGTCAGKKNGSCGCH